jgi:hypothetical protein
MSKAKRSRPFCRRQFLHGAGGVAVGLPFLPSLATSQAYAQDPVFPREKFFYALRNNHGGALESSMFPGDSVANQQTQYESAGHIVRHGQLSAQIQGNNTVISSVLTAPTSALSAAMVRKLNVIRGLDTPMKIGHNNGGVLGNFQDSTSDFGIPHRPTIDQIMAYSPSFYLDTAPTACDPCHLVRAGDTPTQQRSREPCNGSASACDHKICSTGSLRPSLRARPAPNLVNRSSIESWKTTADCATAINACR